MNVFGGWGSWLMGLAGWAALFVGFQWRESVRSAESPKDVKPPITLSLRGASSGAFARTVEGSAPVVLGMRLGSDADVLAVGDWIRHAPTIRIHLALKGSDDRELAGATLGDPLKIDGSASDESRMIIARAAIDLRSESATRYTLDVQGGDDFFFAHDPFIRIGEERAAPPKSKFLEARDPKRARPGLLMIAGLALAFTHAFFVVGRAICPWRRDAPPPDELIL